ncbi:MAG: two-component system response regulator [Micrococcales bacterium]|nr:two-component system response regulator [Micrococcales bacterium]
MKRLLVVDDDSFVREMLRDLLEEKGYEVVEAEDGPTALAAVSERVPDLVILDIMMPGLSGIDVLKQLRKKYSANDLPVILLTAKSDDDTTWQGWTSGVSVFLPKPFDNDHLFDWVRRLVQEGSTDPSASASGNSDLGGEGQISELGALDND